MIFRSTSFALAFLLSTIGSAFAADYSDLLARIPESANALVMINVESTLQTPLAQKQGWGKQLELAYVNRPVFLPPEASRLVLSASLDASNDFRRNWELAVMDLSESFSMSSIARSEGGYLDTVQGTQVVWTPSDAYFVSVTNETLAAVFPANRQFVSRWVKKSMYNSKIGLSNYLTKAVQKSNDKIHVTLAIDLNDIAEPHQIDQQVRESELLKKTKLESTQIVAILTSLEGAMLRLSIEDEVRAELQVNFGNNVSLLKEVAKPLVIGALKDLGFQISELEKWKVRVDEKSFYFAGNLSDTGIRRVFSIVELPSSKFSMIKDQTSAEASAGGGAKESKMRENSIVYYRSVDSLLSDLKSDLRETNASAAVMERYARKIDRMPILDVDPALLDYGSDVAETLRMVAQTKRQGGIDYGTQTAGMGGGGYVDYSYNYGGGRDVYAGARQSAADRSAAKAQAMAASKNARVTASKLIADSTAAIRRAMTEKYRVEF